jgi:hypothetical protein
VVRYASWANLETNHRLGFPTGAGGDNTVGSSGCVGGAHDCYLLWGLVGCILWWDSHRISAESVAGHDHTGIGTAVLALN